MPEEVNRILTDRISSVLFCPTQAAVENLDNEGIGKWQTDAKVVLSGDVMQDGALFYRSLAKKPGDIDVTGTFVLCTIHRAENTDYPQRLAQIVSALNEIAETKKVILPLHPRTKKIMQTGNYNISNLTIIDPVGYLNMVWLIDHCSLVMTDSGGLQKEAFFFGKVCVTMRDQTEWVELIESGANELVGPDKTKIIDAAIRNFGRKILDNQKLYGGGKAAERIVSMLVNATV